MALPRATSTTAPMAAVDMDAAVGQVVASWPGREAQVAYLYDWMLDAPAGHLLVTGPSGSGKTGVIRCVQWS